MNSDLSKNVVKAIERYIRKEVSGSQLSLSIRNNLSALEGISEEQRNSIGYYDNFFEMEGEDLYHSNKYIDEEISDLITFLDTL